MSSNSNSRSHKASTSDSKSQKTVRNILAFVLFLFIVALSMSVCAKVSFINPEKYAEIFTDQKYTISLYNDVLEYGYDICDECSIPTDSVDDVITYISIYNIEEAYAEGNIGTSPQYTPTTYDDRLEELNNNLVASTNSMLKEYKIKTDSNQKQGANSFADRITDYVREKVEFEYMDKLQTVSNLGNTVSVVLIVIFAILTVILGLIVFSIGNKKYRGLRAIAYSFISSALLQLIFVFGMEIVKKVKTLVIYPTYLCDAVMKFVNSCIASVGISSIVSFGIALVIIALVWKLKRKEK